MRIVILAPKLHAGAELAFNKLLKRKNLDIVGVVRSDISPLSKKYWKYSIYGLRRAGLFYGLLIGLMAYLHVIGVVIAGLLFWRRKRVWKTFNELKKKHGLKVFETDDINSKKSIEKIKAWKPDVLVTLYFDQILKKEVIEIPKKAALNMHPGILPQYKGVWPEFWKMKNKEKFAGVTIHHLTEGIDAGEIVAQIKFPIKKEDTKFGLALKSAKHGTGLLADILKKLKKGKKLKPIKKKGKAKYYSLPKGKHFKDFFAKGKKLFSFKEVFKKVK